MNRFLYKTLLLVISAALLAGCRGSLFGLRGLGTGSPGEKPGKPTLLYLSPSRSPELWMIDPKSGNPTRLTSSGGNVYDYAVSPDGSRVIYSAWNSEKGIDLWEIDPHGGKATLLLPCGTDWCFGPAVSPVQKKVAYSRRVNSGLPGGAPVAPQLWLLDQASGATSALYPDPNIGGADPAWSPDGRYLAFSDELSQKVRVVDFQSQKDLTLSTGQGASLAWSPDSLRLYYTEPRAGDDPPALAIAVVNMRDEKHAEWLSEASVDYSVPAISPDGQWAVVSRRLAMGSAGKQLWRMRIDGTQPEPVAEDPLSNFAGYSWNPAGGLLAYQRLSLGSSDSLPQVEVWDSQTGVSSTLAEDAFQPAWLP